MMYEFTYKEIKTLFEKHRDRYKGLEVKTAIAKEGSEWTNCLTVLKPLDNADIETTSLDYGDFIIIKVQFPVEHFSDILEGIQKSNSIEINGHLIDLGQTMSRNKDRINRLKREWLARNRDRLNKQKREAHTRAMRHEKRNLGKLPLNFFYF